MNVSLRDLSIAQILKTTRKYLHYSQNDYAKLLKIPCYDLEKLEKAKKTFSDSNRDSFCNELNLTVDKFEELVNEVSECITNNIINSKFRNRFKEEDLIIKFLFLPEKEQKKNNYAMFFCEVKPIKKCKNNASYGEICLRCGKCGRRDIGLNYDKGLRDLSRAQILKTTRRFFHYSKKDCAELLKISYYDLEKLEKVKKRFTYNNRDSFCNGFNFTEDEFEKLIDEVSECIINNLINNKFRNRFKEKDLIIKFILKKLRKRE